MSTNPRHDGAFASHVLPDSETWAIINALRVAADQYTHDAQMMAEPPPEGGGPEEPEARKRLVKGFEDQAKVARSLADSFENAESITLKCVSDT
jgi:hypothetical protein